MPPADAPRTPPIPLLAFTAGAAVANLYYCQPLLPQIGRTFGVAGGSVGLVSTATQVGYALGLLFFVPLGDAVERRRLIVLLLAGVTLSLGIAAAAPSVGVLVAASVAIGMTTVVPQLVVPFAAGTAPAELRGRVVGTVMGGLLIGILAARFLAGVVGGLLGWRAMFAIAAALMLLLALLLARLLPADPPRATMGYGALLRSLGTLAREEPVVRDAATIGALCFVGFSAFWTTLAFRLELAPLHYGSAVAGAFGLVGIVGASTAPLVGRMADARTPRATVGIGLAIIAVAWAAVAVGGHTLTGLVVGVILLDAGMQVVGVSNQTRIYRRAAERHNRLNTIYMVTYFVGGALGSALGVWAWDRWRWAGVCALAAASLAAVGGVYVGGRERGRGAGTARLKT